MSDPEEYLALSNTWAMALRLLGLKMVVFSLFNTIVYELIIARTMIHRQSIITLICVTQSRFL